MKYLIFDTEDKANTRNQQIAIEQGAGDNQGDITQYWFAMIKHQENDLWCLCIPEDDLNKITEEEKSNLKDYNYLENNGWITIN
jgi:hypothetical protein